MTDTPPPATPPPAGWGVPGGTPPPAPGWGAAPWPPPVPHRKSARPLVAFGVVLFLVVGVAVVVVLRAGTGTPSHPKEWDSRVAPIAAFVERARGLRYDDPVYVDFLTPAEYTAATTGGEKPKDPTSAQREAAANEVASFRALGLVQGAPDLLAADKQVSDSGTLAFYSPEVERVIVRGTRLTPSLRVTLAHELTHALQDQRFRLKQVTKLTGTAGTILRSVVEGDAIRIEDRYVATELSAAQRTAYESEQRTSGEEASDKLEGSVPKAILAGYQVPYIFGPRLVSLVDEERGPRAVDALIEKPPASMEQVIDPLRYLEADTPRTVVAPALPQGATQLASGPFGSVQWFMLLAERLDPRIALTAIDGWGGDATRTYRTGGASPRVCVEARFTGDTVTDGRPPRHRPLGGCSGLPGGSHRPRGQCPEGRSGAARGQVFRRPRRGEAHPGPGHRQLPRCGQQPDRGGRDRGRQGGVPLSAPR